MEQLTTSILVPLLASLVGGGLTGVATVAALRADVGWLKLSVTRLETAIERAHQRIDNLEGR